MKNPQRLRGVRRLFAWQLGMALLLGMIAAVSFGTKAGLSALLGGLVSVIPNAIFAWKLFQYQGARAARQIVNSFYKGEALKITLSAVLFALVFIFFAVVPLIFFAAFIAAQMVFWFAPLIFDNKLNRPKSD
ncbi:F0F1 ATP synthase subunit I [Legionella londiniensis]|uniref:F0F1 ATP synthase subunit I n=1 Tax=Legionella londiniensis TaxID=45068 RepID=UPI001ED98991|nr:F0F1 ATP synthase subunit I [Legionella londiniensis]